MALAERGTFPCRKQSPISFSSASASGPGSSSPASRRTVERRVHLARLDRAGQDGGDHGRERLEIVPDRRPGTVTLVQGGHDRGIGLVERRHRRALSSPAGMDPARSARDWRWARFVRVAEGGIGAARVTSMGSRGGFAALRGASDRILRSGLGLGERGRVVAGQLALAAGGGVGVQDPAGPGLVDLGGGDPEVGLGLLELLGGHGREGPLHVGLDDLLGDPVVHPALGVLLQALDRGGRVRHGWFQEARASRSCRAGVGCARKVQPTRAEHITK